MNPEGRTLLPGIAFRSFIQRFIEPTLSEGFLDITKVDFEVHMSQLVSRRLLFANKEDQFKGTPEQRQIWRQYWVSKFFT